VNLNGCVISDQDLDTFTVTSDLVIDAQDYAVLSVNATTATNGGISVDYAYPSDYQLANTSDEVVVTCGGVTIDIVAYTPAFMGTSGTSTSLSPGSDHIENDSASNWCAASTVLGSGDEGTPGSENDDCP
jgi:hypothetical protein